MGRGCLILRIMFTSRCTGSIICSNHITEAGCCFEQNEEGKAVQFYLGKQTKVYLTKVFCKNASICQKYQQPVFVNVPAKKCSDDNAKRMTRREKEGGWLSWKQAIHRTKFE